MLAVDAVIYELDSTAGVRDIRENYREFHRIRGFDAIFTAEKPPISMICTKVPYLVDQGIFLTETGITFSKTGRK